MAWPRWSSHITGHHTQHATGPVTPVADPAAPAHAAPSSHRAPTEVLERALPQP